MQQPQFNLGVFLVYGIGFAIIGTFTLMLAWDYLKELRNKKH